MNISVRSVVTKKVRDMDLGEDQGGKKKKNEEGGGGMFT